MRVGSARRPDTSRPTEIATRIAEILGRSPQIAVVVTVPAEIDSLDGFDAYVIGSAVYMGHLLMDARELVQRVGRWTDHPAWLFSSGPIGDPPKPAEQTIDVRDIVDDTSAREHRSFAGALGRDRLGFAERAVVAALYAPYGDFRDWDAIDAWAANIATSMTT
jgi:menaquinone-dependent protoporphyrinogen oxidase